MSSRTVAFCFVLLLLGVFLPVSLQGQEARVATGIPHAAASPEDSKLQEARARIAELEAQVAEMKKKLAEQEKSNSNVLANSTKPTESEAPQEESDITPGDEKFRFLDLGVRKNYIGAERRRLIDQLHTMIPPLYEPAFSPFHGYTLPPGAFRVSINADRFINNHDFGRDKVYARFFDNIKVENQHVDVDVSYGLNQNNTLRVVMPLRSTIISGNGKAFRIKPMVMTMNGQAFGIGDVQVMLKHKWSDQAQNHFNFATVFGVQLPTGKHNSRFNDAQTIFMNGMAIPVSASAGGPKVDLFSDDQRIPNSAQPGTGSWGAIFGVMGTRQLTWNRLRAALHGGVLYKAMKNNSEGVRPGNELTFAVSFVRPPLSSERFGEHLTFDLTLMGRNKQSERYPGLITHPDADENGMPIMNPDGTLKMFTTPRPPFEHGTVIFVSPAFVIIPKSSLRLTVSPLIRLYEPNRGPSPAFRLVFGATSTF